uniref:Uncharacterized protein n=1 Tax=Poecilia latipinna TaxID=48699 RepID=A0A3B3W335_9TELE
MENWKIQLVVVTFCVLMQTSKGSTSGGEDERRLSRHWQYEFVDSSPADSLMKRSKALRFYGLMGKRAGRNKGVAFVGLMGRSVSTEGEQLLKNKQRKSENIKAALLVETVLKSR